MDTSNFKEVFESPKVKTLTAQVAALEVEVARLREVLERAGSFIHNGIELGFIRMPDCDCPDPAHETPEIVWKALSTPFTPTALNELIEKVEKMTIERCATATAAGPEDSYQDDWFKAKCKAVEQIHALPTGVIKLKALL